MRVIERFCESKISEVEGKGTLPVLGRKIKQEEEKVNDKKCFNVLRSSDE